MGVMKTCFKCHQDKPLSDFYKHPMMGDGHLGKCKECTKNDVRKHRAKTEGPREYDRKRWAENQERRDGSVSRCRKYREVNPEKYAAHSAVSYAVKSGKLKREPCTQCGATKTIHAHHE